MEILRNLLGSATGSGEVMWLGTSAAPRAEIISRQQVEVIHGGLEDDHHCRPGRRRQITLLQYEHLQALATLLDVERIFPEALRRNILISKVSVASLRYCRFQIGSAVLQGSGSCPPCSRMEENLGPGGYAAMLGHGGITATVVTPGTISIGDPVEVLEVLPE